MNENDRIQMLAKLKEEYDYCLSLDDKKKKLQEYMSDPKIKDYLQLVEDVDRLSALRSRDPIKYTSFEKFCEDEISYKIEFLQCNHDIYIYDGSYMLLRDPYYCQDMPYPVETENNSFDHNQYKCLQCGSTIKVRDWKQFEKEYIVLKDYSNRNAWPDYHKLFCSYLYSMPYEKAKATIIQNFKDNNKKENAKHLIKKPVNVD